MTLLRSVEITRRGMLQGAVLVSGYMLSSGALRPSATPTLTVAGVTAAAPIAERTRMAAATYFTPGWTQQASTAFPVQYRLVEREGPSTLRVDWDRRLFTVQDMVTGVVDDDVRVLSVTRVNDQRLIVSIPADVAEVVFRVDVLNPYPNENLADVRAAGFTLADSSGKALETWRDVPTGVACAPWSVEAKVNWICHDGWIVPARIALSSIGPTAAPAGSVIRTSYADVLSLPALVDPATPEAINPSSIGEDTPPLPASIEQVLTGGINELILTTTHPMTPGEAIEMLFSIDESNSRPRPFSGFVPRMTFTPPPESTGLRLSGRHSDFPVTSSGSQRSTYLLAATA